MGSPAMVREVLAERRRAGHDQDEYRFPCARRDWSPEDGSAIQDALVFGTGSQGAEEVKFGGTHTGTLRSPGGDIPATGKAVLSRYAAVSRVEEGRITSFHMYFDLVDVLAQLGVMP